MNGCCTPRPGGPHDLVVIGAGSAGFSGAITAAEMGARVLLIGEGTIGGTCVNVGCVPSKALIRAVEPLHLAQVASRFSGVEAEGRLTDWQALQAQKQALVDELRAAKYTNVLPAWPQVAYREGHASFNDAGQLTLDGQPIEAKRILLATGSHAHVPEIAGLVDVPFLTSTEALELAELPRSMIVIGAGYIGAELAQMFARAGVAVTLVSRRGLLPEAEPEIRAALSSALSGEGLTLVDGIAYEHIEKGADGLIRLRITRDGAPAEITGEALLLATGRVPNSEGLNLPAAGIETLANGGIRVDGAMATTRPGTFAAGDVTGRDQFVYMAAYGAKLAVQNALGQNPPAYDNSAMPAVVFTDPQVASVGLGEEAARAAGHEVTTSVLPLAHVPRALAARDTRGLIKLVADRESKKLLGAHIVAPEGSDSIQTAALAIRMGLTYEALGSMIFPYLTTVEGLKLASQTFERDVAQLSCCAG